MLIAAIAGVLIGIPTLRLRGDYLAIVTVAFGLIVPRVFMNADDWTGGAQGIVLGQQLQLGAGQRPPQVAHGPTAGEQTRRTGAGGVHRRDVRRPEHLPHPRVPRRDDHGLSQRLAVEFEAMAQPLQAGVGQALAFQRLDPHQILLLDAAAFADQLLGDAAVLRQHQQAGGVDVQPAGRCQAALVAGVELGRRVVNSTTTKSGAAALANELNRLHDECERLKLRLAEIGPAPSKG